MKNDGLTFGPALPVGPLGPRSPRGPYRNVHKKYETAVCEISPKLTRKRARIVCFCPSFVALPWVLSVPGVPTFLLSPVCERIMWIHEKIQKLIYVSSLLLFVLLSFYF